MSNSEHVCRLYSVWKLFGQSRNGDLHITVWPIAIFYLPYLGCLVYYYGGIFVVCASKITVDCPDKWMVKFKASICVSILQLSRAMTCRGLSLTLNYYCYQNHNNNFMLFVDYTLTFYYNVNDLKTWNLLLFVLLCDINLYMWYKFVINDHNKF